jgi:hypothetical protein
MYGIFARILISSQNSVMNIFGSIFQKGNVIIEKNLNLYYIYYKTIPELHGFVTVIYIQSINTLKHRFYTVSVYHPC